MLSPTASGRDSGLRNPKGRASLSHRAVNTAAVEFAHLQQPNYARATLPDEKWPPAETIE